MSDWNSNDFHMLKRTLSTFLFIIVSLAALSAVMYVPECSSLAMRGIVAEKCGVCAHGKRPISDYDNIMKSVGNEAGIDWRLLSAIAYTESHFNADAVSSRGAVGLMQIMPKIGEHFGLTAEELQDPHNNVRVAAMLLDEIDSMVQLPAGIPREDSLGIVLACYNGGLGHVSDARRLARANGEDMNSWDVVSRYLALKSDPEYYEQDVVSYGKFSGGRQTSAYVRNVMKRYKRYCSMTDVDTTAGEMAERR